MKYLKGYKLFESVSDIELSDIQEIFYNISDQLRVSIHRLNVSERLVVIIKKSLNVLYDENDLIDFNDIKDDIEFAIDYLKKEKGLELFNIYVGKLHMEDVYGTLKRVDKYYQNFNSLLKDDDVINNMVLISLYFK